MSKKKNKRKRADRPGAAESLSGHHSMEKVLADMNKLLEEQDFESIEEVNAFLEHMMAGGPPVLPPETPLEEAQELIYQAMEVEGRQRVRLARKALKISPDCADAYVLLAEEARSIPEAYDLYEKGVRAGERALGKEIFAENAGHFWGILNTRPYMRARAGLATILWLMDKPDEAIEEVQDMLRLNPGDNQGLRYSLVNWLLATGRTQEAAQLLREYDEGSASWLYSKALLTFRQAGATRSAKRKLHDALAANPYVPAYLLGSKRLPRSLPEYIGIGDDSEAVSYAAMAAPLWRQTEGAIEWLAANHDAFDVSQSTRHGRQKQFQLDDAVAMKRGALLDEYQLDISGWQGWVVGIEDDALQIAWDSRTLRQVPEPVLAEMIDDGIDWTGLNTLPEFVRPARPRDDQEDRLAVARERYARYGIDFDDVESSFEDEWDDDWEMDEPPTLTEWFEILEIPGREQSAIRRCLKKGLAAHSRAVRGRDIYRSKSDVVIEQQLGLPFILGYSVLEILQQPEISYETKVNVSHYTLESIDPALVDGVPYGVLTILGFLAREDALSSQLFVTTLLGLEHAQFTDLGELVLPQGATPEALAALAGWLAAQEELTVEESTWLIWKLSLGLENEPHLNKALVNQWLDQAGVPSEWRRALCRAWLEGAGEIGTPPMAYRLMDALVSGDRDQLTQLLTEKGLEPDEVELPDPEEMPSLTAEERAAVRQFLRTPGFVAPYLRRLAIPSLVRLGEDLKPTLDSFWSTDGDLYVDAQNQGVADAIAEFHDRLTAAEIRQWIERGVGHGRAETRKAFYALSTRFYSQEFLHMALEDNAKAVRRWAAKKLKAAG